MAETGWIVVPRKTQADDPYGYAGQDYGGPHETTHLLNSQLRNQAGPGWQACYVMRGRAALLREPAGITLTDVAHAVPAAKRGPRYDLYLVQQAKYWNDTPSYVLDELAAYTNGWECYTKTGDTGNAQNSHDCAIEFIGYATVLADLIAAKDPSYDVAFMREVIDYQHGRLAGGFVPQT